MDTEKREKTALMIKVDKVVYVERADCWIKGLQESCDIVVVQP